MSVDALVLTRMFSDIRNLKWADMRLGDGNTSFDFQITANSFSTQKDDYLAVNITNTTTDIEVKTGGAHSYITAPDNTPCLPHPGTSEYDSCINCSDHTVWSSPDQFEKIRGEIASDPRV